MCSDTSAKAQTSDKPAQSAETKPTRKSHLFTADEIPKPPEWMRKPPSAEGDGAEGLFGTSEEE